jgi:hypothetical protein
MSLPAGRGTQRVRSCGRARKRDETGRPVGKHGGGNTASGIGALLSKDSIECSRMRVNRREHRAEGKGLSIQYFRDET